ncbi:MAG: nicotinate (nicotinamide) nucleotide adenylyltransferase [Pseudomonadota bacterium]
MKRLAVFGGAFDPPHSAHVAMVEAAAVLQPDRVVVIPTGQAWHKVRPLSGARHRVAMCRLAFAHLRQVEVDERETRRTGPSYTADTLAELRSEHPSTELLLLIGGDQADALASWHRLPEVLENATVCIAERGHPFSEISTNFHMKWPRGRFLPLPMPPSPANSTAVRQRIAHGGLDELLAQGVVNPGVARYIAEHHLYRDPE